MPSRPKILVIGLEMQWHGPARLPKALQAAGFEVGVACRKGAFLARTKFRDHFFPLPPKKHGHLIFDWLQSTVAQWTPDLILPMDDQTALFLAEAFNRLDEKKSSALLKSLLQRSLGNPSSLYAATSKRQTIETARGLGLRVPVSRPVASKKEALLFAQEHGFPLVLKRSFDCGGNGVFVCKDSADILTAFKSLHWPESLGGRLVLWREHFRGRMMGKEWLPADKSITASQFIAGKCAFSLVAAYEGELLGVLSAEVEHSHPDTKGPSTVVSFVRNEEIRRMSQSMVKHWGLSGLIGFDFMLDAGGKAWLIECNPRPTPIAHLGARAGEDLCLALHQKIISAPLRPGIASTPGLVVAHFPQESWRDSKSAYIQNAFHDVPWDDPELLQSLKDAVPPSRHAR